MYFIVYLIRQKQNVIIPVTWVRENEKNLENFVNDGMNSNHIYYCFWSQNDGAVDENGTPNAAYIPRFNIALGNEFPNEGCYLGKIVRFCMSFDDASAYRRKRRQLEPAIYNARRLLEQPIPDLNVETASDFDDEDQLNEFSDDGELPNADAEWPNADPELPNADAELPNTDPELPYADCDEPVMEFKAEPESVIELAEEDIEGLYDLINENEETTNSDDEIEMTVDGAFPMPIQVSSHDLVKRKDDWLSDNLPFNDTADGCRIYMVGSKYIKILKMVLNVLKSWTKYPENESLSHDKRFVQTLLYSCAKNELKDGNDLDEGVVPFIRALFIQRVGDDGSRQLKFQTYVDSMVNKYK